MAGPSAVGKEIGVSASTVRNYTLELSEYLSEGATPGKGKRRNYSPEDIEVFRAASELRSEGLDFDAIRGEIAKGTHRVVRDEPAQADSSSQGTLVPISLFTNWASPIIEERDRLLSEVESLQDKVFNLEREVGRLEGHLEAGGGDGQVGGASWWRRIFRRG